MLLLSYDIFACKKAKRAIEISMSMLARLVASESYNGERIELREMSLVTKRFGGILEAVIEMVDIMKRVDMGRISTER